MEKLMDETCESTRTHKTVLSYFRVGSKYNKTSPPHPIIEKELNAKPDRV
jgi:hypothetical protein